MKKKYVLSITNIIVIVILLVSFSFAWMTDELVKYGRWAHLVYEDGQLVIMATDLDASLYVKTRDGIANDDDNYEDFSNKTNKDIFTAENFAPGEYLQYRLDITTRSKIKTTIQLNFAGIETDSDELADKLIFGTTKFVGFWQDETQPSHVVTSIGDKLKNGMFIIFNKLELPQVQSTSARTFSIYWYIFFDRTATNESAVKYFNIPHLYIVSI